MADEIAKKQSRKKKRPSSQLEDRLKELETKVGGVDAPPSFNPIEHKDKASYTLAITVTWGFFILLLVTVVWVPLYNGFLGKEVISLKDVLPIVGGLISSPFAFVLGHYFKSDH